MPIIENASSRSPHIVLMMADYLLGLVNSTLFSAVNSSFSPGLSGSSSSKTMVVENCGAREVYIRDALLETSLVTSYAKIDADHGSPYHHGYEAMFKSLTTEDLVRKILDHMAEMEGLLGLRPDPHVVSSPRFACVDARSGTRYKYLHLGYDPFVQCQSEAVQATTLRSFYAEGTSYIFLCDNFFLLPVKPPVFRDAVLKSASCPQVVHNKFDGWQRGFHRNYQIYRLVYQLSRFYLGRNALDSKSDPKEVFDWNDCVHELNALESVLNPTNMELYVACKSQLRDNIESHS